MKSANYFLLIVMLTLLVWGCEKDSNLAEFRFTKTFKNTETYAYDLNISGDEEGATIIEQATHFQVSELKRDASTNWRVVYYYQPTAGFSGKDSVKIETCTGGVGTTCGKPDTIKLVFCLSEKKWFKRPAQFLQYPALF